MAKKPIELTEEQINAINYGKGSKNKNIIHRNDFLKLLRERVPSISSQEDAKEIFKGFCDAVGDCVMDAQGLALEGHQYIIGTIHLRPRKPTTKLNLQTQDPINIPAKVSIRLRPRKSGIKSEKTDIVKALTDKFVDHITPYEGV